MLDPKELYRLAPEQPAEGELERPVLLHALGGFIDAGFAGKLAADHLLETLPHRVIATFDVDQLYDYRARRPPMMFVEDHWESYEEPALGRPAGYRAGVQFTKPDQAAIDAFIISHRATVNV